MAVGVTRDHHNLRRNLKLNGNYISNDGGDEGISINDDGLLTITGTIATPTGLTIDVPTAIELDSGSGDVWITKDGMLNQLFAAWNADAYSYDQYFDASYRFQIKTLGNGATTLSTVDGDGEVGHLTLAPDGDCIIDRNTDQVFTGTVKGLHIDYDHDGSNIGSGQVITGIGLDIDMDVAASSNHALAGHHQTLMLNQHHYQQHYMSLRLFPHWQ